MKSQIALEFLLVFLAVALAFSFALAFSTGAFGEGALGGKGGAERISNSHIIGSARNLGIPFRTEVIGNSTAPAEFRSYSRGRPE